jgi:hypothetical protein
VTLAWRSPALDKRAAHRLEARLKMLTRAQKLAIASGDGRGLVRQLLREVRQPTKQCRAANDGSAKRDRLA